MRSWISRLRSGTHITHAHIHTHDRARPRQISLLSLSFAKKAPNLVTPRKMEKKGEGEGGNKRLQYDLPKHKTGTYSLTMRATPSQ